MATEYRDRAYLDTGDVGHAKVPVVVAAKIMGVTPRFIHLGLQHQRFPFGTAVKFDKRWSYYINTERFIQYMEGGDMGETSMVADGK